MRYNNFMNIFDFLDKLDIPYSNTNLIKQAFIHSSYINEHKSELGDNERLEFVGDAVLQYIVLLDYMKLNQNYLKDICLLDVLT